MKTQYSILSAVFAFILFTSPLAAQVGTPWDQQIKSPGRFQVLIDFGGGAVFDRETGLVWEQSPIISQLSWNDAQNRCNGISTGGRLGWRLPTIQELASLVDPNNPNGNPDLPPGHPFSNVQSFLYWSATTLASNTSRAWFVNFGNGVVGDDSKTDPNFPFVWCARGGQGVNPQ